MELLIIIVVYLTLLLLDNISFIGSSRHIIAILLQYTTIYAIYHCIVLCYYSV